ncbi:hypothetical protein ECFDA517_6100, partial [Escherichia coli FDA517]|jgi:hypothetical protein
MVTP